ncbi:MAG: thioesterase family protein [Stellaceae bacterium]
MRAIPQGASGSFTLKVMPDHLASRFKDAMLPPVLATPYLVLIAENAALDAIRHYLDPGESAVGTAISLEHLAPTPAGHTVRGHAEVVKVEGRRVAFKISVRDEIEEIGRGTHARMVIDVARFMKRLKAKSPP